MDPRSLVRSLEAGWQEVLDAVLLSMRLSTRDISRLAPKVEELSRAYNMGLAQGRSTKLPLEARVAFSFPRDVPKGAAAVRELVASGALAIPKDRPLHVIDLGAGLGAMTWGLVRALRAAGGTGTVDALLVDEDERILETAMHIARAARSTASIATTGIDLRVSTRTQTLHAFLDNAAAANAAADVVLLGQVLSEVDLQSTLGEKRIADHAALLAGLLDTVVAEHGSLVVIEPALRERTRHLHAVRDRLLETTPTANVFAPCLHRLKCPALAVETEWCHEDLPVDLPSWVVPLAKAAGLRWQGLTFSYLVLRRDKRQLLPLSTPTNANEPTARFRVISDLLRTKGKAEVFACTEEGIRPRLRRLDRDAGSEEGVPFHALARGDIVSLRLRGQGGRPHGVKTPSLPDEVARPIDDRGRVKAHVAIDVGAFGEDENVGGCGDRLK